MPVAMGIRPVGVGSRANLRGLGVIHEREIDKSRRKNHHLVDAGRVHVLQPRMRVSGTGVSPDLFIPLLRSRLCGADNLLCQARMPGLARILPFARGSEADL